ncbi:SpoIIE family protein phosphatase [Streptomyces cinnabarinus]|uniref:SpoIIE family protein phosphatase n=1 Tax=Streptomyces cinnabarinus TaxID=67287 RepID=A0ABY7KBA7_9ACTN|nr:ATP-binding SpoIIE family protein phosphatase [Streptomyces cinnabarinus]WAZ21654.1 SpoIIE family protein phosphatase [Streptomyces cinnabarinus]
MGAIPTQREIASRASDAPEDAPVPEVMGAPLNEPVRPRAWSYATLPGSPLAPGSARALVRAALTDWSELGLSGTEHHTLRLIDDTVLVVSELVTNAVVHAGTDVELVCRAEDGTGAIVVEVSDRHPARAPRDGAAEPAHGTPEYGRGLSLVARLAESWGVTYRTGVKTVWARLPAEDDPEEFGAHTGPRPGATAAHTGLRGAIPGPGPRRPERDRDWLNRGALSFLAEASDLLAGQLDENLVAALTGQLLVPRLADWCAVWLEDEVTGRGWALPGTTGTGPRLARVWHGSENRIEELRRALEKEPPRPPDDLRSGPVPHPWPGEALGVAQSVGTALAYRLIAGGRPLGTLVIGRAGLTGFPDEITGLVEDLGRRVALAIGAARQYARQATISAVLQRGLLPGAVAEIPGVRSALVYEPCDKGGPSGDFYDLFPAGDGRWCFAVGDVQGKGPEAAVVIGLARPWLRLLAREGYRVADVLDRLNQLLLDDATEAADAGARALVGPAAPGDGPQTRFLSLLYGELAPFDGGVRCTLASAGHPLPLLLGPDGAVRTAAQPQTLLGVIEDATYTSETFELLPGDSLLCVTDGVTERRSGSRQFDDADGLATAFAGCAGLSAQSIAERIRRLVHDFGGRPPEDDLALLVLQAE